MAARLGDVIYWFGCIIGGLILATEAGVWLYLQRNGGLDKEAPAMLAAFAGCAFVIWLIGRAFRYILAGR